MPFTADEVTALPRGTRVTVTYQPVDGEARKWHLQTEGSRPAVLFDDRGRLTLMWCGQDTTEPGATEWTQFGPIWPEASPVPTRSSEWIERKALLSLGRIAMQVGAPGWSVSPLTGEGQAWLTQVESPRRRYDRLAEQVSALDPALASALNDTIDDLIYEARTDGAAAERQHFI